jgi:hypothetical protein
VIDDIMHLHVAEDGDEASVSLVPANHVLKANGVDDDGDEDEREDQSDDGEHCYYPCCVH